MVMNAIALIIKNTREEEKKMKMLQEFWTEEDGMAVVEILLIMAVLIIIAILFRKAIIDWVNNMIANVFTKANEGGIDGQDLTGTPIPTLKT